MGRSRGKHPTFEHVASAWQDAPVLDNASAWLDQDWLQDDRLLLRDRAAPPPACAHGSAEPEQLWRVTYDTFGCGKHVYGLPSVRVQTVLTDPKLTWVPGTHPAMLGIVSVRGVMVPVLDGHVVLPKCAHGANAPDVDVDVDVDVDAAGVNARAPATAASVVVVHAYHDWLGVAVDSVGPQGVIAEDPMHPAMHLVDVAPLFAWELRRRP